jgi:PucR family transcriptional regulator, purine catabolism regulatory protein
VLADDDRLRLFVARELGALKEQDASRQTDLLNVLRAFVRNPGRKSDAAAESHMSRSTFYDRLARIAQVLGVDLDDPDILVSRHVAVLADAVLQGDEG